MITNGIQNTCLDVPRIRRGRDGIIKVILLTKRTHSTDILGLDVYVGEVNFNPNTNTK
tara:strand:+ start:2171 stop:2344 length:174 start_codon:yes stop_codon:yes gene_type:complete